ncbi:hypothetical protein Tco_0876756 [Tanacetum coccineum]|uniref:Uncharacterized protein n=1 Tax=Tanacetum coccineum TaxID=301880 RepID=A0ABQ5BT79_9ASTR
MGLNILYKVGSSRRVESSEDEGLGEEDASKQGRIADIDANKDIYLVNVQIKRLLDDLRVTAAQVCVTAAKLNTASVKLVLLVKIEENILSSYYCLCSVNAAGV